MKRLTTFCLTSLAILLFGGCLLHAQPGFKEAHTDTTSPFFVSGNSVDYHTALKMSHWANGERQKQLVKDTARLVDLTHTFKEHMAAAGSARPTEADLKLIAQIEKLAHTIRDEMANAGAEPQPPRPHADPW